MPRWLVTFATVFGLSLVVLVGGGIAVVPIYGIIALADDNIWLGVGGAFAYLALLIAAITTILEVRSS